MTLFGGIDVHGPSTERIDVEAAWSEWVDDVAKPAPERVDVVAAACGTEVGYDEDLVVLARPDASVPLPDGTALRLHKAVHQMGDTQAPHGGLPGAGDDPLPRVLLAAGHAVGGRPVAWSGRCAGSTS